MIKKFDAYDIAKIGKLNKSFMCDKAQYTQYLMQRIQDKNIHLIGNIEDDKIKSYALVFDNRQPPINNSITIYDMWSESHAETLKLVDKLKKLAIKLNSKMRIVVPVDNKHSEKYMSCFNANKIGILYEWDNK